MSNHINDILSSMDHTSGVISGSALLKGGVDHGNTYAMIQCVRVEAAGDYEVVLEAAVAVDNEDITYGEVDTFDQNMDGQPFIFNVITRSLYRLRLDSGSVQVKVKLAS